MTDRFQLCDFDNNKALGSFDTLADAQREVTRLGLVEYEIHLGDRLVDFGSANPAEFKLLDAIKAGAVCAVASFGLWAGLVSILAMFGPLS